MSQTVLTIDEIVSDPSVRRGRPVIRGTALRVSDVVLSHLTGDKLPPEEIAARWQINLGQVYAALAYYYLHREEIEAQIREDEPRAETLLQELEEQR